MTTFTIKNFTISEVPDRYDSGTRDLIRVAIGLGWAFVRPKNGHCTLVSHDKQKTINCDDAKRKPPGVTEATIFAHANPLLAPDMTEDGARRAGRRIGSAEHTAEAQRKQREREENEAKARKASEAEQKIVESAYPVYDGPMIARKNVHGGEHGKGYESPTTWERKFSDGTVEYSCRWPDCDFPVQTNRTAIARHWKKHKTPAQEPKATIEMDSWEPKHREGYTPRADRVKALGLHLLDVLKNSTLDPEMLAEKLAEEALHWSHEQSTSGSRLAGEREDLTPEQVLDQIRSLVDRGQYITMREEIAALRADLDAEAQKRERAEKRARKHRENAQAAYELVEQLRDEDDEEEGE